MTAHAESNKNDTTESKSSELRNIPLAERMFFFDIDNCLYPLSTKIYVIMRERIVDFMIKAGISDDREMTDQLCNKYHTNYGLSIRGLLLHHDIDPVAYDKEVDGSLPIEELIKPDPELRDMLQKLKTRKWAFTNAGLPHAQRVLAALGISDQFEGITYCNYAEPDFPCKPEIRAYNKAMHEAKVNNSHACYFVDDAAHNVETARTLGWTAVHVTNEPNLSTAGHYQIHKVTDLPKVLPELWQ
ncbi:pyrimidine nucleotidase [Syncephalis plumigaleata]|nr:pyrimidine nucleotidase [Syncephalis plumigaleata]